MRLRWYLAGLVLAGLVPFIVLTGAVTTSLARQQRAAVERGLTDTVAALASAIDSELNTSIKSLETLATSKRLDTDDLTAFYDQAMRVRELHRWTTIGLIDQDGAHRLNLAQPLGAPLPDLRDREYFKQVMATRKPYVSDLLRGRATRTLDIGVAVPVIRSGRLKYVLFAGLDPATFTPVFEAQELPAEAVASIVSRDGTIISRSPGHTRFVGTSPPASYLAAIRGSTASIFHGPDFEHVERYTAYQRMTLTGWTVGFALPAAVVNGPVRRIAWTGAVVGAAIVAVALGLAAVFAGRMAKSITTLAASAAALGRGEPPGASGRLPVSELDEMRRFLIDADGLLQQRAQDRAELLSRERTARAQAEAASNAKDHFLAMLGHELRNPLGAISSAAAVLGAIGRMEGRAEHARAVIERQSRHLSRLVDDLLDMSRITTGKIVLDRQPVDLAALVTNVLGTDRTSGRLDRHRVSTVLTPVWIEADETRMEQVVSNLVSNALKYTPMGGGVTVRVEAEDEMAILQVTDTGIGISTDLIDKVFDLFVQGDRALDRDPGGLGLGLTVVRSLVAAHGGTVHASSPGPGQGAVFTVRLPRLAAPASVPASTRTPPAKTARRRVLVVEDNEDAREMLRVVLDLLGHEVHVATDGPSAVDMTAAIAPDIALIDVGLPGLDGYEVARRIRSGPTGASVLLVAITGYGQAEDRRRALDSGFDAHLTKPASPDRLIEILASAGR